MVAQLGMKSDSLQRIADDVAQSLSYASVHGRSAFISTALTYANGARVVVRIDQEGDEFFVSDDGYANTNAEMFGGTYQFHRLAPDVARRFSVNYDRRSFFVIKVVKDQLPAAVVMVANASSVSVERTLYALDRVKVKKSRELFLEKVSSAFGEKASFDVELRGATKSWEVDAAVMDHSEVIAVLEFVTPSPSSVAFAHMKVGDISSMMDRPKTAIVLSDYDGTEAPLRQILSSSADVVIPANSDLESYRLAA